MAESAPLSVTELAAVLKGHVAAMGTLEVAGEVSGHKHYAASGHHYFTLKDEASMVSCVLYAYQARWLKTALGDGMRVVLRGKADFYGKTGKLSLIVDTVRPEGEGDLFRKFKELQARLAAEGLFDEARKRPLPERPKVVAFVTSAQGAVWHDFTEVLRTRGWSGQAWLVPVKVQGDTCPGSVAEGLVRANGIPDVDIVVVGRGGGSMEDLWGFNDEKVVRAVVASARARREPSGERRRERDRASARWLADPCRRAQPAGRSGGQCRWRMVRPGGRPRRARGAG